LVLSSIKKAYGFLGVSGRRYRVMVGSMALLITGKIKLPWLRWFRLPKDTRSVIFPIKK